MTTARLVEALLAHPPACGGLGFAVAASEAPAARPGQAGPSGGRSPRIHPDELAAASGMHPRRRDEFLLGRGALRLAIASAGLDAGPVLAAGRRPAFPAGIVGSLSHSGGVAVAIAAAATRFHCLGIDVETRALPLAAAHLVLNEPERAWLAKARAQAARTRLLLCAFCAKEAAYKALDPILDRGAPRLRGIRLRPTRLGFVAWAEHRPDISLRTNVRDLRLGVLAWTGLRRSAHPQDNWSGDTCT